ncbi:hypothetical protein ZWY2020_023555 [Hordeum vulgare]|nr:hypothetical protein ZWY2020_023555 [Hordeum vulgare]
MASASQERKSSSQKWFAFHENVLAESRMMIPDCHNRLETTLAELKATLAELKESGEQGVEIGEAESTITEVETVFEAIEDQLTSQERRCIEVLASILVKYLPLTCKTSGMSHEKYDKPQQAQATTVKFEILPVCRP